MGGRGFGNWVGGVGGGEKRTEETNNAIAKKILTSLRINASYQNNRVPLNE